MTKNQNREKINPAWASMKGSRPTWNSYEDSHHYWRKTFFIKGKKAGKLVQKKFKKFNRDTIRMFQY